MGSFLRKLATPFPLITFAASIVTFWATGVWWLLPAGFAAGAIIAAVAGTPEPALPEPVASGEDGRLRPLLEEKAKILSELARRGADNTLDQPEIASRIEAVIRSYRELLLRLHELKPILEERGLVSLQRSIEEMERQQAAARDPIAKETLTEALSHRRDERNRLEELSRYRERAEARLLSLGSALTNLRVRLVQSRVAEEDSAEPESSLRECLNGLFLEVEIADRTARELNKMVQEDQSGLSRPRAAKALRTESSKRL